MNSHSPIDPEIAARSQQLLHEAGYVVEGLPPPKPRGVVGHALAIYRPFVAFIVAGAIGAITNLVAFFAMALAFANQPREWVHWYFGNDGWYFFAVTIVIACVLFPRLRKLKLV
jgi:hypothetical protein